MTDARGLTLVEVAVALVLLAIGALALAAGITSGERARRQATARGLALAAAEGWLEEWRASPWPAGSASGIEAIRWGRWRGEVRWRTTLLEPCLLEARVEAATEGDPAAAVLVTRRFRDGEPVCGP